VKDQATTGRFDRGESERLVRGFLSPRCYELGLICRADDRGDPVVQFAPPLVAGADELGELERILRQVLGEAFEQKVWR
jgi:adenosylmethionine-8-amino-7-oxononanoate aminotransferase